MLGKQAQKKEDKTFMFQLQDLCTHRFGLKINDSVNNKVLEQHIRNDMNPRELEKELNKLIHYCIGDSRDVMFHDSRLFPYILHKECDKNPDYAGILRNYTSSDFYFIAFVKNYLRKDKHGFSFIDVDFLLTNADKVRYEDAPLCEMCADVMFYHLYRKDERKWRR